MRSLQPPRAATWLLKKLGCNNEALVGDLIEEYSAGRSAAWYWRQVLVAIPVGFSKEIWDHKLLALRAIATGWATGYLLRYAVYIPFWQLDRRVRFAYGYGQTLYHQHYVYPETLIWCICVAATGWIVARCHRGHRAAMVLIYLASMQLWSLPEFYRLTVDTVGDRRFLPYLFAWVLNFVLVTASVLVGGLWSTPRKKGVSVVRA
jgi:hypothetical protein